ncbi:hypothetical protein [Endozoicomonas acroporae]|uniref:hypothetical protein n=1 Tax=Endozoicomonas acroporae TaxID=1701104 RepID=UPI003D79C703
MTKAEIIKKALIDLSKKTSSYAIVSTAVLAGPALADAASDPGKPVVDSMIAVFTQVGGYVATLMVAAATLFGLIQGGTAVFKIGRRLFGAAGA